MKTTAEYVSAAYNPSHALEQLDNRGEEVKRFCEWLQKMVHQWYSLTNSQKEVSTD